MRYIFLIFCGLLILSACRTAANYNAELNRWVGKPKSDLIAAWGAPNSTFKLGRSEQIITYVRKNEEIIPPQYTVETPDFNSMETLYAPFTYQEDFAPQTINAEPGFVIREICQTSFHIKNGRVQSWQWRGNDCAAY